MDEQRALELLDQQFDAALANVTAPPQLSANVLAVVRKPRRLPEVLDAIGTLALVATLVILLLFLAPAAATGAILLVLSAGGVCFAFAYAVLVLRET